MLWVEFVLVFLCCSAVSKQSFRSSSPLIVAHLTVWIATHIKGLLSAPILASCWPIKQHLNCNLNLHFCAIFPICSRSSLYLHGCSLFWSRQNCRKVPEGGKLQQKRKEQQESVRLTLLQCLSVTTIDPVTCLNYCLGTSEAFKTANPLPDNADNITEPW